MTSLHLVDKLLPVLMRVQNAVV